MNKLQTQVLKRRRQFLQSCRGQHITTEMVKWNLRAVAISVLCNHLFMMTESFISNLAPGLAAGSEVHELHFQVPAQNSTSSKLFKSPLGNSNISGIKFSDLYCLQSRPKRSCLLQTNALAYFLCTSCKHRGVITVLNCACARYW